MYCVVCSILICTIVIYTIVICTIVICSIAICSVVVVCIVPLGCVVREIPPIGDLYCHGNVSWVPASVLYGASVELAIAVM